MSTPTGDQGQYGGQGGDQYGGGQQYGGQQPQYGDQQYGQQPGQQPGQQYGGQQPYPNQQYGAQGYPGGPGQPVAAPKNGLGIAALVLGILAIILFWTVIFGVILGLLAIILGGIGLSRANKGVATNKGVAIGGIVTGALGLIASVVYIVFVGSLFLGIGGGDLVSCLQQAGSDTAAQQQCQVDFQNQVERQTGSG